MEHLLQLDDPVERLVELGAVDPAEDAVEDRLGVPGAEEDRHPASRRQLPPEPPHRRPSPLLVGGLAHGVGLDAPGVEPLQQQVDRLRLARPADPGDDHDDREVGGGQLPLGLQQGRADLGRLALVGGLVDLVAQLGGLKHDAPATLDLPAATPD